MACFETLPAWLNVPVCLSAITDWMNSNFVTSLVGAMAGAWFGAQAAQKIAERAKLKDESLRTLSKINSASTTAHAVANRFIIYKKQLTRPLYQQYVGEKNRWIAHLNAGGGGFELIANFKTINPIGAPVEALMEQIYGSIDMSSKGGMALSTLSMLSDTLAIAIATRNELIEEIKLSGNLNTTAFRHQYFGTPNEHVGTDTKYSDLMRAIDTTVDDGIFFSILVAKELEEAGNVTNEILKSSCGIKDKKVRKIDFSDAAKEGLLPNEDSYAQWVSKFQ